MIRQCMSVLRKEAQLAQHKPLDRLEEVSRHVAGSRGGWGCDVWQGHTGVGCGVCDTVHVGCVTPDGLHQHHGNQASQA